MAEEDDGKEYRWETGYEKTWEAIKEDAEGLLEDPHAEMVQRGRRRQRQNLSGTRLGMMRHLYLILDQSEAMTCQDLKPTRHLCTLKLLEKFVEEFFDQNPISQLGIITTKNKRADRISELAGNPCKHLKVLRGLLGANCTGEPSLQNALDLALRSLRFLPAHASREVLILMASLTTCDPGDILVTVQEMKALGVRCSVLSLAAEVHLCRLLARETGGQFGVVLDDCHFQDLLLNHVDPLPAVAGMDSSLIKMGFPHHHITEGKKTALSECMCHLDVSEGDLGGLKAGGYFCPQCSSKYCELPVECRACGLTLVSAPHLARSYHHLFPVEEYQERERSNFNDSFSHCFSCRRVYTEKQVYECPKCAQIFCLDCDIFIHETMHVCPGCATNQNIMNM